MIGSDSYVPEYKLEEKGEEIIISIFAPLSKPKEAALLLEKEVFTFDSPPYLLKLKLPHPVSNSFSQPAYNAETSLYLVKLKKSFRDPEVDSDEDDDGIIQHVLGENAELHSNSGLKQCYGFANKYSNMFGKLYEEFLEVINVPDPDNMDLKQRHEMRIKEENEKWNDDHYLADTMETDHLEFIFKYKPPWIASPTKGEYSSDDKEMLEELIKNSKLKDLSSEKVKQAEHQLVDILYGYAYNKRTTEGDNSVESGWTINKLSATLSWLEEFEDFKMVLLSCYRRALIYPLYRNWNLVQLVHKDVVQILKLGPKQVTRSLLEVREIFNENDNYYILNTLYVNDLCGFAYFMSNDRCKELSAEIEKISVKKYEVHNDLPLLEIAAHLTLEEETHADQQPEVKVEKIVERIASITLCNSSTDSSESDSDDSDSSQSSDNELP